MAEAWVREAVRVAGDAAEAHISDRLHEFDHVWTGWRVCRCGAIDKDGSHRTSMVIEALYYRGFLVDPGKR